MGLITSLAAGFIAFLAVQYFAPNLSIWVAVFVAGLIAGLLAEGILKGLFVGLVISVIGIFIAVYFLGGVPGFGTDMSSIVNNLTTIAGGGIVAISAAAGIAGSYVRKARFKK
jgi:hypothetical protein